jgi:hypothetical protein
MEPAMAIVMVRKMARARRFIAETIAESMRPRRPVGEDLGIPRSSLAFGEIAGGAGEQSDAKAAG